jgi:DNA-binding PadR family transcriptional regulator
MRPTNPWTRPGRSHSPFGDGGPEAARRHHPHDHQGRDRFEGPRRSHRGGPFGGPGGPFQGPGDPEFGPQFGHGPRGERGERGRGGPRRGRGRAGRGDVRTALLLLLREEPMHGYQLMQAVADRTGGGWRLSPGAVYPTIAQLEDEGLVQVSSEGGRRLVTLTEAGRTHVEGLGDADPFAAFAGDGERVDLRGTIGQLIGAAHQLDRVADPAQLAAAAAVLDGARRALYLILAGEARTEEPPPAEAPTT